MKSLRNPPIYMKVNKVVIVIRFGDTFEQIPHTGASGTRQRPRPSHPSLAAISPRGRPRDTHNGCLMAPIKEVNVLMGVL